MNKYFVRAIMKIIDLKCEHMPALIEKTNNDVYCINEKKPHFSFCVEGADANTEVRYFKLIVSSSKELAADGVGDMYDSGIIYSSEISDIVYNGKTLLPCSIYYFKIYAMIGEKPLKSGVGAFATGIGDTAKLRSHFIAADEKTLKKHKTADNAYGAPAPYFRKDAVFDKEISSAYLYATALGVYELYINGTNVNRAKFAPGFTDYYKTLQYNFYDVGKYLKPGENTIGAIVGDGWYKSSLSIVGRENYGDKCAFSAYLYVIYDDGSYEEIYTDESWDCFSGAYVYTDNQNGEYFDARLEDKSVFLPSHGGEKKPKAEKYKIPFLYETDLIPAKGPDVKEMLKKDPVSVTEVNGKYIVDMGQNMVGCISVKLHCKAGTKVIVRHGEMLNDADKGCRGCDGDKGTLYTANLRTAKQTDTYICCGKNDVYQPRFTYHGFRYAEISGIDHMPSLDDITGHVMYSACAKTGNIETSEPALNRLISNITWGQRGNFFSLPTDCPQRDERLGWTGDAQVFSRSACYGMDCCEFFKKYLRILTDAQKSNGSVTDIAPMLKYNHTNDLVGNGNAGWGDVIFTMPYVLYNMYGDKRVITDILPYAEKYYEYLQSTAKNDLRPDAGYGDWLSVNENTPKDVMATAFYAYDAYILKEFCRIAGDDEKASYYGKRFEQTAEAFREEYLISENKIKGDTQGDYVFALKFGLLDGGDRESAVKHLIRKINEANGHLNTGFMSVGYLLPVLCDNGYAETAYDILLCDTYPSWLYSVKNGATTVWERWNSYTAENGFGDVGMNSFNHYSLGSCYEWMYEYMLGIKPASAGYREFYYRPYPDKRIGRVSGVYNSMSGQIVSEWKRNEKGFDLRLTVPVNTKATVTPDAGLYMPGIRGFQKITEKKTFGSGVYLFKMMD